LAKDEKEALQRFLRSDRGRCGRSSDDGTQEGSDPQGKSRRRRYHMGDQAKPATHRIRLADAITEYKVAIKEHKANRTYLAYSVALDLFSSWRIERYGIGTQESTGNQTGFGDASNLRPHCVQMGGVRQTSSCETRLQPAVRPRPHREVHCERRHRVTLRQVGFALPEWTLHAMRQSFTLHYLRNGGPVFHLQGV
jgi:hypothetical protein